tara:strand:+ start:166 stop:411 length:246 start_codon:yes stop_codon:yes gene_type:complete
MKTVLVLDAYQPEICLMDGKKMTSVMVRVDGVWKVYCDTWKYDDGVVVVELGEGTELWEVDEIVGRYLGGDDLYTKIKEVD